MTRKKFNYDDYIGQKMNRLEILSVEKDERGTYLFKCKCDCGNFCTTRAHCVVNNQIKSCGCYRKDKNKTQEQRELAKKMGLKNRKHDEKCDNCGANEHYANGLCHNCYERYRRNGNFEYKRQKKEVSLSGKEE